MAEPNERPPSPPKKGGSPAKAKAKAAEEPWVKRKDSGIHILTIHALPPISMIWNPALATQLDPDKVRRWYVYGSIADWTKKEVHEFTNLCCISHHGPVVAAAPTSVAARGDETKFHDAIDDFHTYVTTIKTRQNREVLLHHLSLEFCRVRAKQKRWIIPESMKKKFLRRVAVLCGDAPPPKHHHHHHSSEDKEKHHHSKKHHHHHHHHHDAAAEEVLLA